jgi:hypothetical protein
MEIVVHIKQSIVVLAVGVLLAACSGSPSDWWRSNPNYTVPPINNG